MNAVRRKSKRDTFTLYPPNFRRCDLLIGGNGRKKADRLFI